MNSDGAGDKWGQQRWAGADGQKRRALMVVLGARTATDGDGAVVCMLLLLGRGVRRTLDMASFVFVIDIMRTFIYNICVTLSRDV